MLVNPGQDGKMLKHGTNRQQFPRIWIEGHREAKAGFATRWLGSEPLGTSLLRREWPHSVDSLGFASPRSTNGSPVMSLEPGHRSCNGYGDDYRQTDW